MASINVQSPQGDLVRSVELPDDVFDVQVNVPLIHQVVVAQLAAARQGTHDTKTRGEVRGGGRKPYKQKGTGRARQGSTRAPQFTGGGTVHGPTPRGYAQRTPKKMKAAALRGALSDRARGGRLHVVAQLVDGDTPSTKAAAAALARIASSRHVLLVAERTDVVTWKSLRNVDTVHVLAPDQLNTYDVLVSDDVVFTEGALAAFLNAPGSAQGKQLGDAVDALAQETAAKGGRRTANLAQQTGQSTPAPSESPRQVREEAVVGDTKPAGEGVGDEEMAEQVADQTSKDLKAEAAFEKAADKDTDKPADEALSDETPQGGDA